MGVACVYVYLYVVLGHEHTLVLVLISKDSNSIHTRFVHMLLSCGEKNFQYPAVDRGSYVFMSFFGGQRVVCVHVFFFGLYDRDVNRFLDAMKQKIPEFQCYDSRVRMFVSLVTFVCVCVCVRMCVSVCARVAYMCPTKIRLGCHDISLPICASISRTSPLTPPTPLMIE